MAKSAPAGKSLDRRVHNTAVIAWSQTPNAIQEGFHQRRQVAHLHWLLEQPAVYEFDELRFRAFTDYDPFDDVHIRDSDLLPNNVNC